MLDLPSCTLRPWRLDDEAALIHHANDREVSRWLRDSFTFPYTVDQARSWLACSDLWQPPQQFAIEVDGAAVGGCGIELGGDVYRHSAEIGYWLGREVWGRGLASEVVPALTDYVFAQFTVERVVALVFEGNHASARVLTKAGFERESVQRKAVFKYGQWLDQWVYVRLRQSF